MTEAVSSLEAELTRLEHYTAPPTPEQIIKTLAAMATLFSAPPVDQTVIDLYIAALSRIPRPVFAAARDALVLSHKWPRLPTPADFVEAGESEAIRIRAVRTALVARIEAYKRASKILHTRTINT